MLRDGNALSQNTLISLKGVSKTYPITSLWKRLRGKDGGKTALTDITLDIRRGEVLHITGDNGAGKTTLLKIIMGLLSPTTGDVVRGGVVSDMRNIGFAGGGERCFHYRLTGWQNITFFGLLNGFRRGDVKETVKSHLVGLNMTGVMERRYQEMSAGEKRKLAFLRAFIQPRSLLLIIDEFGSNIDERALEYLCKLITSLKGGGVSIMLASTNPALTRGLADNYLHLVDGTTRYYGSDIDKIIHSKEREGGTG